MLSFAATPPILKRPKFPLTPALSPRRGGFPGRSLAKRKFKEIMRESLRQLVSLSQGKRAVERGCDNTGRPGILSLSRAQGETAGATGSLSGVARRAAIIAKRFVVIKSLQNLRH